MVRSGRKRSSEIDSHRLCVDEQRLELDRALDLELLVLVELYERIVDLEAMQR